MDKDKLKEQYPANSHKKKTEKVVKGKVVKAEKSLGRKFQESFLGTEATNVGSYILFDVLIPELKNTIYTISNSWLKMILFQEESNDYRATPRNGSVKYTPYNKMSAGPTERPGAHISDRGRSLHKFDELKFPTRPDAEDALSAIRYIAEQYGVAGVHDLYDAAGLDFNSTDYNYGWDLKDIVKGKVERVRDGYIITLPKTIRID